MDYNNRDMNQSQRDIVLSPNEYVFVQNNTNGVIKTYTGPMTVTISTQDSLVRFNEKTKQFEACNNAREAKQLFVLPPENWYAIVKNPTENGVYPEPGKASMAPELRQGRKINIKGPASFALFPGQMAKVIKGHALRTNQYLLARVYEAEAANNSVGEVIDQNGEKVKMETNYVNGQMLVIKGTEVSFYIPPTGIEVLPVDNNPRKGYVREAITLERLEYCILKDEDGNKSYTHGPAVVFPKPTESFVTSPKGGYVFRAIELSKISGIYVKVIAEYKDEMGVTHPVGEELFITGDDQMIYYPRPEHAVINYDNKITHHAIAIPEGEGRYVMNRLTGEINTVCGPAMYLPDPRTEVVVKRKLSEKECNLWYPGNQEALLYNVGLSEKAVEKSLRKVDVDALCYSTADSEVVTMANLEAKANISRGTSYTKPRTITLDNKYDGVVSINVWTGYAVKVVSKNGERKVVCGPQTILLDYDQTLEVLSMSTGKPKSTDFLEKTVYLHHENNQVSDIIEVETSDFVKCAVKVSYKVDFKPEAMDKWFNVENYTKHLCDRIRSIAKKTVKEYTIEEFYQNYVTIIRDIALGGEAGGRYFEENGMNLSDCEVLGLEVEKRVAAMLNEHQSEMVKNAFELTAAKNRVKVAEELKVAETKEAELANQKLLTKMELQRVEALKKIEIQAEVSRKDEAEKKAKKEAERDMQILVDAVAQAALDRKQKEIDQELDKKRKEAEIEKAKQDAYAATVAKIMASIGPDLVAAMNSKSNAEMTEAIAKSLSPYVIAGAGENISDVVNKITRGTSLEDFVKNYKG